MNVFVDVQGFKIDDNEFILKEIAILIDNQVLVLQIKPPFPYYELSKTERRQVSWIERNRGILWKDGFIPYSLYKDLIAKILSNKLIYTKGLEKASWLQVITGNSNVCNLEDKNCPNLVKLYELYKDSNYLSCIYHTSYCALTNVLYLRQWFKENKV